MSILIDDRISDIERFMTEPPVISIICIQAFFRFLLAVSRRDDDPVPDEFILRPSCGGGDFMLIRGLQCLHGSDYLIHVPADLLRIVQYQPYDSLWIDYEYGSDGVRPFTRMKESKSICY